LGDLLNRGYGEHVREGQVPPIRVVSEAEWLRLAIDWMMRHGREIELLYGETSRCVAIGPDGVVAAGANWSDLGSQLDSKRIPVTEVVALRLPSRRKN